MSDSFINDVWTPTMPLVLVLISRIGVINAYLFMNGRQNIVRLAFGQAISAGVGVSLILANQANTNRLINDANNLLQQLPTVKGKPAIDIVDSLKSKKTEGIAESVGLSAVVVGTDFATLRGSGSMYLDIFNMLVSLGVAGGMMGTTIPKILDVYGDLNRFH
jgi:hypothetical protein